MIEDIENRIQQLKSIDINSILTEILKELVPDIVNLNVDQQHLRKGIRSDNSYLGVYSEPYAKRRQKKGLQTRHVDLQVTGEHHRNYTVKFNKDSFELTAPDDYVTPFLEARYGPYIFGLAPDELDELRAKVKPLLIERLRKILEG